VKVRRGAGGESHPAPVFLNAYFSRWVKDDSDNIEKMDFLSAMPRWFILASGVIRQERKWLDFFYSGKGLTDWIVFCELTDTLTKKLFAFLGTLH
jgi:hypothetical protein